MKYTELVKKLTPMNAIKRNIINLEKKKIELKYLASTISNEVTTQTFNIVISDELLKLLTLTGEKNGKVILKDIDENTVKAYPDYAMNVDGYRSWKGEFNNFLILNDEIIYTQVHTKKTYTGTTYYGWAGVIRDKIGVWNGRLIAKQGNDYVIISKENGAKRICSISEPESGNPKHVKTYIEGNIFVEEVYEYCDCDLKHGDWCKYKFDLNEYV